MLSSYDGLLFATAVGRLKLYTNISQIRKTGLDIEFLLLMDLHLKFPCLMTHLLNFAPLPIVTIMIFSDWKVSFQLSTMFFCKRLQLKSGVSIDVDI